MRLLTRSDFDGLACGALLKELAIINNYKFVHPKDMQDGTVAVDENDVLANVPYVRGCKLWFDHHSSESERLGDNLIFEGESRKADSAARIIFEYYGGVNRLPHLEEMVIAVDKMDSARLTADEILNPTGWVLLGFIMDPRTGLGRFKNFRISNYELMEVLIEECRTKSIDEILENPDVKERIDLYFEQDALFREMILKHSRVDGNLIITDMRGVETIYAGNRFVIYSLFPEQNISMWIVGNRDSQSCSIGVGHSIINRGSKTDVGTLLLMYGGGGHYEVGTCQVPCEEADKVIRQLTELIKQDG